MRRTVGLYWTIYSFLFQAFYPTPVFNEDTPVDESSLMYAINEGNIPDATLIYGMLQNKGTGK